MAYSMRSRIKPVQWQTSQMVVNAIKNLSEPGGSSLRAIKKYIAANYEVDIEQMSPFIKEYLKGRGSRRVGAAYRQGSFRLFQAVSCKEKESCCTYCTSSWASGTFICPEAEQIKSTKSSEGQVKAKICFVFYCHI